MKAKQATLSILLTVALAACSNPFGGTLAGVKVEPSAISPNADGKDDLARIEYRLRQPAKVQIYLTDAAGEKHYIRHAIERAAIAKSYTILFNGIDENGRMLANGDYTWHVVANGEVISGPLTLSDADTHAPKIVELTMDRAQFTPNRDGIDDRIAISLFTNKVGVLSVYVIGSDNVRYDVPPKQGLKKVDDRGNAEAGRWNFDYDGGIDLGADPPPDGLYTLYAELEDRSGQHDIVTRTLTIKDSGRPVGEIMVQPNGDGIEWEGLYERRMIVLPLGGTLHFTTTIANTGNTPIRTAAPSDPNDCYQMDDTRYTKNRPDEPGMWRLGVDFETNRGTDHPWRWGVGTAQELDVVERDGSKLYYLAPGARAIVRGCIVFTKIPPRNPFTIWASLIQEDVEIMDINQRVSPVSVQLVEK